jgi:hypothetical protein
MKLSLRSSVNSTNQNNVLRSVSTPVLKSLVSSNFSAKERNAACQGEICEYKLSTAGSFCTLDLSKENQSTLVPL